MGKTVAGYAAFGAGLMGGLDLTIQGFQNLSGGRDGMDWDSVKNSVIGGAIGGAAAGVAHGAAVGVAKMFGAEARGKFPPYVVSLVADVGYMGGQFAGAVVGNVLANLATHSPGASWAGILAAASKFHGGRGGGGAVVDEHVSEKLKLDIPSPG
ncbi:hypothetical protein, partial [Amycolatopsis pigmentata]